MNPLNLRPGQHVWFQFSGCDTTHQGTTDGRRRAIDSEHYWSVTMDDGLTVLINESDIRRGEIRRCEVEMADALPGIANDEGALLGYRDWMKEKKILKS